MHLCTSGIQHPEPTMKRGAKSPIVSIVLPFHNEAATLDECLDSIQAQTFSDFELLAIDDASDDQSVEMLEQRVRRDARIRLLHSPGRGVVSALNHGLSQARSHLIARMDADDIMHPDRLQRQYDFLQANPMVALLGTQVRLFPESEVQAGYREYIRWQNSCLEPHDIAGDIYIESPFAHPTVMFRREVVQALGGYRQGPFPEDYDLWLRLHHAGHKLAKLPEILLDWRERPNRVSRIDSRCSREAFDRLRAHHLATDPQLVNRRNELVIWGAGRMTRKRCQHLLELGYQPQAWIDIDPCKIGNRLKGVPVMAPDWLEQNPRPFVLCYVANHGARDLITEKLHSMGYKRGQDYLMVG